METFKKNKALMQPAINRLKNERNDLIKVFDKLAALQGIKTHTLYIGDFNERVGEFVAEGSIHVDTELELDKLIELVKKCGFTHSNTMGAIKFYSKEHFGSIGVMRRKNDYHIYVTMGLSERRIDDQYVKSSILDGVVNALGGKFQRLGDQVSFYEVCRGKVVQYLTSKKNYEKFNDSFYRYSGYWIVVTANSVNLHDYLDRV